MANNATRTSRPVRIQNRRTMTPIFLMNSTQLHHKFRESPWVVLREASLSAEIFRAIPPEWPLNKRLHYKAIVNRENRLIRIPDGLHGNTKA